MWVDLDVVGGFDDERTPQFNAEDTVNWYVILDETAKKPKALQGCPGLLSAATVSTDAGYENRTYYAVGSTMYALIGDTVFRTSDGTTYTSMGNITTSAGFARMVANNAGQILLVDGAAGYIIDTNTNSFTQVTDPDFPVAPIDAAYLDGFFIVLNGDSTQFNISAPNDGLSWDFFDFAQVNAYSGNLVGVAVVNRRIFFMKTTSTEVWYNGGFSDFPFRRDNNLLFNYGALNAWSIQSEHGFLFWLSQDKSGVSSIVMSNGLEPIAVSSQSVDNKIRNFTVPADCSAYIYKDNGHLFYNISWTTDDKTYFYDATVGKQFGDKAWYRLEMQPHKPVDGNPNASKTRHLSQCHAFFNNQHFIGSYKEARIYKMSLNYTDNDGEPIGVSALFGTLFRQAIVNCRLWLCELISKQG